MNIQIQTNTGMAHISNIFRIG